MHKYIYEINDIVERTCKICGTNYMVRFTPKNHAHLFIVPLLSIKATIRRKEYTFHLQGNNIDTVHEFDNDSL